jgi:hypothetical protein
MESVKDIFNKKKSIKISKKFCAMDMSSYTYDIKSYGDTSSYGEYPPHTSESIIKAVLDSCE